MRDHLELLPITELCCPAEDSSPMAYRREGLGLSVVFKRSEFVQAPFTGGEGLRDARKMWAGYGPHR